MMTLSRPFLNGIVKMQILHRRQIPTLTAGALSFALLCTLCLIPVCDVLLFDTSDIIANTEQQRGGVRELAANRVALMQI